ncbi:hypothetical protein K2X05_14775 [bacterium]|nr:hypothetical protein [bacterium]
MNTTPTILPFDYCHRWIRAAFNMAEKHFKLFAVLGLVVFLSEAIVSITPYIGSIANPVLRFVYTLGGLRILQDLMEKKTVTYDTYFRTCFEEATLKRFKNYLIASAGVGLLVEIGMRLRIPHFYLLTIFTTIGLCMIPFMAYWQMRNPQTSEKQAMDFIFSCAWKNVGNLLVHAIFLIALGTAAMALCVVPFFLYFMPLTFPLAYLVYMGLCEGKTIEEILQIWNSPGDSPSV